MRPQKLYLLVFALSILCGNSLNAQVLFFDGLGRAIVTNDKLGGNLIEGDTLTANKGTSGYTLLDFGINVKPSETFKVRAEFRARNNFGQFFGAGTSVNMRQFQLDGLIKNKVYYSLGDIDVGMTSYTVVNNPEIYHSYESEIFATRRRIAEYENFNNDNQWRVQGLKVHSLIPIDSSASVDLYGFISRTRQSSNAGIPDRFLAGASANLVRNGNLELGLNYVGFFDNSPSTDDLDYENNVLTVNYTIGIDKEKFSLLLIGESGLSSYDFNNRKKDTSVSYNDYFIDGRIIGTLKPAKIKLSAGYINVGPQFSSPSAQTQRIYPFTAPDIFPTVVNGTLTRSQTLFDRFSQERMYNQSISPVLFQVLPIFSNVLPYGTATPNRSGIVASISQTGNKNIYELSAEAFFLSDIVGEGTNKLRKYRLIRGGVLVNLHSMLQLKRNLTINAGIRNERTEREGFAAVNFSSTLIDGGLTLETLKDLDLLVGIKLLNADGNEYVMERDEYNYAINYIDYNADITQQVLALGVRFRFTKKSFATAQYYQTMVEDKLTAGNSFDLRQFFLNYTIKF